MVGLDPPLCKLKELVLPLLMKDEEVLGVEQPLITLEDWLGWWPILVFGPPVFNE